MSEGQSQPMSAKRGALRPTLAALLWATGATCFLGWLFKANCTFDGQYDNLEFYVKGCYSDAYPFWRGKGLADGAIPYFDMPVEYPVLAGLLIWIDALLTHALFGAGAGDPAFIFVVSLVNTGFALAVTRMLWGMRLSAGRLWAWALSPLLLLYVGHNWDLLAVTLALAAFIAAERGQLLRACSLAALGTAAKLFPVLLLPLFALRQLAERKVSEFVLLAGAAIATWLAINLPVALAAPEGWWEFYAFSSERSGTRASIWELLGHYQWLGTDIPTRNVLSLMLFLTGFAAILNLGWKRYKDRLWLLAAPVVLWFLLTNKVYSPQFDLWVFPLILITARRWPPIALFVMADIAAYFAELWFFAGEEGGWPAMPMEAILISATVRAVAMIWLIADALRLPLPRWLERDEVKPVATA